MDELQIQPGRVDADTLRRQLKISAKSLCIAFPLALADVLGLPSRARLHRHGWRDWIERVAVADAVLLWVPPRENDDQDFFIALANALKPGTRLWTFHSMALLTIDRLTGDAVQLLLASEGMKDGPCINTGLGYYARAYTRLKGQRPKPLPIEEEPDAEPAEDDGIDVQRLKLQRSRARSALDTSRVMATASSLRTRLNRLDEKADSAPRSTSLPKSRGAARSPSRGAKDEADQTRGRHKSPSKGNAKKPGGKSRLRPADNRGRPTKKDMKSAESGAAKSSVRRSAAPAKPPTGVAAKAKATPRSKSGKRSGQRGSR